jgi:enoyl-CoA hydratase/carnithine racemase
MNAPETTLPILLREDSAGVATLTLNRPAQFNSLSEELLAELQATLNVIAADKSVRAVVIAGAGKAFCSGHDLKQMRANPAKDYQQKLFKACGRMMMTLTELPQPVIARIHGIATAAGCQLVAMCDLAVAAEGAKFAVSGVNLGLFCSTPSVALGRAMGRKQAMEMLLTGDFIDAAEAQRRGLVNRVVPLDQLDAEVRKLTDSICAKTPVALGHGQAAVLQAARNGVSMAPTSWPPKPWPAT